MNTAIPGFVNEVLSKILGSEINSSDLESIGGGSINDCYKVTINHNTNFFIKINSANRYPSLFEKEKNGLTFLAKEKLIQVPAVIACEEVNDYQILVLEWITSGPRNEQFWKTLGEQLAALHQVGCSYFGFHEDNYMGALAQPNNQHNSWVEFFVRCRFQPQITLARECGLLQLKHVTGFESLCTRLPGIFENAAPSLLHGDLWSGNFMCDAHSQPVLIDPAVYFGDRSVDLAMTTLFGGFEKPFYDSYHYHFPFPANYREQWEICNLYPLLVHLNLFGSGYLGQIQNVLRKFK